MPRLREPDPDLPRICTADQALAAGLTRDQVRHRLRARAWQRLARGVYLREAEAADPRIQHIHRALATALMHPEDPIGFESAVLMHGLPLHVEVPQAVSLCVMPGAWAGRRGGVRFRQVSLPPEVFSRFIRSRVTGSPVRITLPSFAWVQATAHGTVADGLVIGDAGIRAGVFTALDLQSAVEIAGMQRGNRTLRVALAQIDGRRESPLESQSWAYFLRFSVPLPQLQVEIVDEWGDFIGRVDTLWPEAKVIGEVDGRSKYETRDDVYREKRREDALRAMGFEVIRWGAADLRSRALALRITRTLARRGGAAA